MEKKVQNKIINTLNWKHQNNFNKSIAEAIVNLSNAYGKLYQIFDDGEKKKLKNRIKRIYEKIKIIWAARISGNNEKINN